MCVDNPLAKVKHVANLCFANPFYRKDIDELEKVQKRALKLSITPVESVPLEQRRLDADLCELYLRGLNRNNLVSLIRLPLGFVNPPRRSSGNRSMF